MIDAVFATPATGPAADRADSVAKPRKRLPTPPTPSSARQSIDKLGHFLSFGLLAVSALFAFPLREPRVVVAVLLALAPVSEALQYLTLVRTPRVLDIGLDAAGIALGVALWWVVCTVTARTRPGSSSSPGE